MTRTLTFLSFRQCRDDKKGNRFVLYFMKTLISLFKVVLVASPPYLLHILLKVAVALKFSSLSFPFLTLENISFHAETTGVLDGSVVFSRRRCFLILAKTSRLCSAVEKVSTFHCYASLTNGASHLVSKIPCSTMKAASIPPNRILITANNHINWRLFISETSSRDKIIQFFFMFLVIYATKISF